MAKFIIQGGTKLKGEITPQGAKNEALQILNAVLLTPEKVRINNIPNIVDVNKLIDLLSGEEVVLDEGVGDAFQTAIRSASIITSSGVLAGRTGFLQRKLASGMFGLSGRVERPQHLSQGGVLGCRRRRRGPLR